MSHENSNMHWIKVTDEMTRKKNREQGKWEEWKRNCHHSARGIHVIYFEILKKKEEEAAFYRLRFSFSFGSANRSRLMNAWQAAACILMKSSSIWYKRNNFSYLFVRFFCAAQEIERTRDNEKEKKKKRERERRKEEEGE